MKFTESIFFFLFIVGSVWAQQPCVTAPMEGYQGDCVLSVVISPDGKYVYSSNGDQIKKWDFKNKNIVSEWPLGGKTKLISVSDDGRHLQYQTKDQAGILDTETGKPVLIDDYVVLAVFSSQNLALVGEVKTRTANMQKYQISKLSLYDLKAKGISKGLGRYMGFPAVSVTTGKFAWSDDDGVKVYDVVAGKEIFNSTGRKFDFKFSRDGKYGFWCGGVVNLETGKVTVYPCEDTYARDGQILVSGDGKSVLLISHDMDMDAGIFHTIGEVTQYSISGEKVATYSTTWGKLSRKKADQNFPAFPAADGDHFYFFDGKLLTLASVEGYGKNSESLDFFGNIGQSGNARVAEQQSEAQYLEGLRAGMVTAFMKLQPSEFQFPVGNHLNLYDYSEDNNLILLGDTYRTGLWSLPEGKLINSFGMDPASMNMPAGASQSGVRQFHAAVSSDGSVVMLSQTTVTNVFKNGKYTEQLADVLVYKIVNDHQIIAVQPSKKKLCLYDIVAKKVLVTYGKEENEIDEVQLSQDRSKLLYIVRGKSNQVFEVQSGKVLAKEINVISVSNNFAFSHTTEGLSRYDFKTKKIELVQGRDRLKNGKESYWQGQYLVTSDPDGPLRVFDMERGVYVSDKPVLKNGASQFTFNLYFPRVNEFFMMYDQGYTGYAAEKETTAEFASGYCVNVKTGIYSLYLFHPGRARTNQLVEQQKQANAPDPAVTSLLNTLKSFPDNYRFNYASFERVDITNNSVARNYFTFQSGDQMFAIGKFCPSFGITQILTLAVKNAGPNEQYNFMLVDVRDKGITSNKIIGTTQKVNGAVTELADVQVVKNGTTFSITVTTTDNSSGRERKSTYTANGCN